jgi:transcription elongation factor Elf1
MLVITMNRTTKCPDCDCELIVPADYLNGEIFQCPCCGLEMEFKNGELSQIVIEGEDWGE